jgi:hypothetical protein
VLFTLGYSGIVDSNYKITVSPLMTNKFGLTDSKKDFFFSLMKLPLEPKKLVLGMKAVLGF